MTAVVSTRALTRDFKVRDGLRRRTLRAVDELTVDIEPGWPVLMARRNEKASAPRISPTKMRSGRMRSEASSKCWIVTLAVP